MNAPTLWIGVPLLAALLLFLFRRWKKTVNLIGIGVALLLSWLALQLSLGVPLDLGAWPIQPRLRVVEEMIILGRQFILTNSIRPVLALIYLATALWIGGAYTSRASDLFVPFSLMIAALLTAALAVKPFLFSAIFIQLAVLLCITLLATPGKTPGRGLLRFLTFQTLGLPLILIAGWMLGSAPVESLAPDIAMRAATIGALGLIFVASLFPFHSWIPLVASESHPYVAGFVLFTIPTVISLFFLNFLLEYLLPTNMASIWTILRIEGLVMVFLGGGLCIFEKHLGRMLGLAATSEIGFFVLALSLDPSNTNSAAVSIFLNQILPRGIAFAIWSLGLSALLEKRGALTLERLEGVIRESPLAALSALLAQFTLAGMPLLAGFPVRLALWNSLAQDSLPLALLTAAGGAGMVLGGVRALAAMLKQTEARRWRLSESHMHIFLLLAGWLLILIFGLFPQLFLGAMQRMVSYFALP